MKIVNFNTSYSTQNLGDYIIVEAIKEEMSFLFEKCFVYELSTHTPPATFLQCNNRSEIMRACKGSDYKFIDGTNIIKRSLLHPWPAWNVNLFNCRPYSNSILIGAGTDGTFKKPDIYTTCLYKRILSKDFVHSTRDEKTKTLLETMGYKAINTGCPTTWSLDKEHCKKIPTQKANKVIFTLTDYRPNEQSDKKLIQTLRNEYDKLYFFAQGREDEEYLNKITDTADLEVIRSLEKYKKTLIDENVDYVGTRLHAAIYAMKYFVRSTIIVVDNRTRDMKDILGVPLIERNDIDKLSDKIHSKWKTNINIDTSSIMEWKGQFNIK